MTFRQWSGWVVVGLLLTGCSNSDSPPRPRSGSPAGVGVGKKAPDVHGIDSNGTSFSLSDYRGKVVLLNFWASW